jgi:hypothetical protein
LAGPRDGQLSDLRHLTWLVTTELSEATAAATAAESESTNSRAALGGRDKPAKLVAAGSARNYHMITEVMIQFRGRPSCRRILSLGARRDKAARPAESRLPFETSRPARELAQRDSTQDPIKRYI